MLSIVILPFSMTLNDPNLDTKDSKRIQPTKAVLSFWTRLRQ